LRFLIPVIVLAAIIAIWLARKRVPIHPAADITSSVPAAVHVTQASTPAVPTNSPPTLGETILRDYANTNRPPENDLTILAHLMENSRLLVKSPRPLSANEDWAAFLRGQNAAHERFLPDSHVALNEKGQVVDRWHTPLFFHALGGDRYDVRSAGPDQKMWTTDDIHRSYDGSFLRGSSLNPPALFDPASVTNRSK
jgi:hypothetical protein